MNKKEKFEVFNSFKMVYSGILFNNAEFANDYEDEFVFVFDCPEYKELISKYELDKIAIGTTDFEKALNLLHYLSPRLVHASYYDNHIECNSLALMEYSFNNEENGINCLNKSKILEEACLAFGIYARRVCLMPFSPYDMDNHVVTEIFSREMNKWIMLDPTTDGFCIDKNRTPLSCLEMREKIAQNEDVAFVNNLDDVKIKRAVKDSVELIQYYAKNLFWFVVDKYSTFGEKEGVFYFIPKGFDLNAVNTQNIEYRINTIKNISSKDLSKEDKKKFVKIFETEKKQHLEKQVEYQYCNIEALKKGI